MASVWAVTCFFVLPPYRNVGLSRKLVAGAVELARKAGAAYVEGYPTKPKNKDIPPAFAHTGLPSAFHRTGFTTVADAGARLVVRRKVGTTR